MPDNGGYGVILCVGERVHTVIEIHDLDADAKVIDALYALKFRNSRVPGPIRIFHHLHNATVLPDYIMRRDLGRLAQESANGRLLRRDHCRMYDHTVHLHIEWSHSLIWRANEFNAGHSSGRIRSY